MTEQQTTKSESTGKGKAFFDRADAVAETGQWDYAIQMYVEGIRRDPQNLQRGHIPLREVGLKRKVEGGKPASFMEARKQKTGKEPADVLAGAAFLLAKDPGSVDHMLAVLGAARQLEAGPLVKWIADILFEAMRQAKRPSKRILVTLTEAYEAIEEYRSAVMACDKALEIEPNDGKLQDMARNLSARDTIKQGKYDSGASFTESVKDMKGQMELSQRDHLAQTREFIDKEIERARAEYAAEPTVPGKIDAVADALLKIEEEAFENEAIDILRKAHTDSRAYRFKVRLDEVKARQLRRRYTMLKEAGDKEGAQQAARDQLKFELEMYAEQAANYPTDLNIKFELGRRQLLAKQVDEAITSLQQAQRDPKRRLTALNLLGRAFALKGWHREAAETYQRALDMEPTEERAKELHYNLAVSLVAMGTKDKALDHFSEVAQVDYNYRDVRDQIEKLRAETK